MKPQRLFVTVNDGYVAHAFTTTPSHAEKIAGKGFVFETAKCGAYGRMLPADKYSRLCATCFSNYPKALTVDDFKKVYGEEPRRPAKVQVML